MGTPDFPALAEAVEATGPLHSDGAAWIAGRGLDPERLEAAGWRAMSGPEAAKLATGHGGGLPTVATRARLVLLIPAADFDGRPVSVRVRPIDRPAKVLTLPGDRGRPYGVDSLETLAVAPDGGTAHICEGESDRESLIEAGAVCVIGLPGATNCHGWLADTLPDHGPRRAVVWFDGDPPGRKAAEGLAGKLTAQGLAVWRWDFPPGMDCNDAWRGDPDGLRAAVRKMEG